jgi:hypothetical protein
VDTGRCCFTVAAECDPKLGHASRADQFIDGGAVGVSIQMQLSWNTSSRLPGRHWPVSISKVDCLDLLIGKRFVQATDVLVSNYAKKIISIPQPLTFDIR